MVQLRFTGVSSRIFPLQSAKPAAELPTPLLAPESCYCSRRWWEFRWACSAQFIWRNLPARLPQFFVRYATDLLNGVPSIVIGIFAYTVVVIPMHHFSALAGGFALGVMMVPIILAQLRRISAQRCPGRCAKVRWPSAPANGKRSRRS